MRGVEPNLRGVKVEDEVLEDLEFRLISRLSVRASSQIVDAASKFSSKIELIHNGNHANAKTIFEILLLSKIIDPSGQSRDLPAGTPVRIRIQGADAAAAMKVMSRLMSDASAWPA